MQHLTHFWLRSMAEAVAKHRFVAQADDQFDSMGVRLVGLAVEPDEFGVKVMPRFDTGMSHKIFLDADNQPVTIPLYKEFKVLDLFTGSFSPLAAKPTR